MASALQKKKKKLVGPPLFPSTDYIRYGYVCHICARVHFSEEHYHDIDCELCYLCSISTNLVLISVNVSIFYEVEYNLYTLNTIEATHSSLNVVLNVQRFLPHTGFSFKWIFSLLILACTSHRHSMLHCTK